MGISKRDEGSKISSDINVTPMVDVMLVLLIIFMVVTPMLQKGVSVDMAKVNNPEQMPDADKEDALLVSITRDGMVYLGSDRIDVDTLTNKVKDRLTNKPDKRVYVKADMRTRFGGVVRSWIASGPPGLMTLACSPIKRNKLQAPRQLQRRQGNRGERQWEWQSARAEARMRTSTSHRSLTYCWCCSSSSW